MDEKITCHQQDLRPLDNTPDAVEHEKWEGRGAGLHTVKNIRNVACISARWTNAESLLEAGSPWPFCYSEPPLNFL